ncbi:MAG: elongation factor Ts [Patescibacteria group bacterium]
MKISIQLIKKLRQDSGAPIIRVKQVLQEIIGDLPADATHQALQAGEKKALEILRKEGFEKAEKKENRVTGAGIVETYIHATNTSGATVVLASETDFVARTSEFKNLAKEIAMQVTAIDPKNVDELLQSLWIKDEAKTVSDLVKEHMARFGENIKIQDFKRFQVLK